MVRLELPFDPALIEEEARTLWASRQLPPKGGVLGPKEGPLVLQFEGTFTSGDPPSLVAQRGVAADVEARYLALAGRRAVGTLRLEPTGTDPAGVPVVPILRRLAAWTGGDGAANWDNASRHARTEALVGRLAHRGIVISRDLPLRSCPSCGEPRSPERIIYQEEEGTTHLIRFELSLGGRTVHALVWVDAPWRLLGTCALLVHPELPYVIARYRRGDGDEFVFTSQSSLERFREWLPRGSFEVLETHPGKFFEGTAYDYPLRHEFPTGGALDPPAGTVLAVPDVTDTGTGVVPLVPGHGSTDAEIADARGVVGWPLVTRRGILDLTLLHKYAGLDLATGSEFIIRDLTESGSIFAQLRVRRGVPHCAVCGTPLIWIPGRAWCLEPSHLPPGLLAEYARLLPGAAPLDRVEVAPWPISGTARSDAPEAVALLECPRCERLDSLGAAPACPCGARRYPTRRLLVPSAAGALNAWARFEPFPLTASMRLYVGERRRIPVVVHHLTASAGLEGTVGEMGITTLPTVSDVPLSELIATHGADAIRSAFVRATRADRASGSFPEHCREERERLSRLWSTVAEALGPCDAALLAGFAQPIDGFLGELETEDRALLARWERFRVLALADYDRFDAAAVHRRLFRFLEGDLASYRSWVRPRIALPGSPATKRAALRTLVHVLQGVAVLLGPIAPHTSEVILQRFSTRRTSLFEASLPPIDRALLQDEFHAAWDRWGLVLRAVERFRRERGIASDVTLPSVALVVSDDALGEQLRADRPVLERLGKIGRLDVGSPREPWNGRQVTYRPVESEIQRVYPSQAAQIAHLITRTPARKLRESGEGNVLSVVVNGVPLRILPTMVRFEETFPEGTVPHPWSKGEMYIVTPAGGRTPDRVLPPLSPDAGWLVRRVHHRLRRAGEGPGTTSGIAVVAAADPLATELRDRGPAIARYLGLQELRVVELSAERPARRLSGRTRTGAAWWVDVPGRVLLRPRTKRRAPTARCRRVPSGPVTSAPAEIDFGTDEVVQQWQSIRELGSELDEILEAPLLGPTKIARAWDQGFTSIERYRSASYEEIADLVGFGSAIAERMAVKFGKVPPRRPTRGRLPAVPGNGTAAPIDTGSPQPPEAPPPAPPITPATAPAPETFGPEATAPPSVDERVPIAPELPSDPPDPASPDPAEVPPTAPPEDSVPPLAEPPEPSSRPAAADVGASDTPSPEGNADAATSDPEVDSPNLPPDPGLAPEVSTETAEGSEDPPRVLAEGSPGPSPDSPRELESVSGSSEQPGAEPEWSPPGGEETEPTDAQTPIFLPSDEPDPPAELPDLPSPEPPDPSESNPPSPGAVPEPSPRIAAEPAASNSEPVAAPVASTEDLGGRTSELGTSEPPVQVTLEDEPMVGTPPVVSDPATPPEALPPESASMPDPDEPVATDTNLPVAPGEDLVADSPPADPGPASEEPPEPDSPETGPATPPSAPSGIEFVIGSSPFTSLQPFLDATAAGHRGLCMVRESPERIAAQVGPRPVAVYWLTNLGRGKTLRPSDLPGIFALLGRSIEEDHVTAQFLEGIEYLVRIHGVDEVAGRLTELDGVAKRSDARIWVHLTPTLLRPHDLERLTGPQDGAA
jgi:hypothetical protein